VYSNPGSIEFRGTIEDAGAGGAFIEFPYSVEALFGVRGRVPVVATFDGIEYRGSMVKMGGACHIVPILKQIRTQLGKQIGDPIDVSVRLDAQPRVVEIPADLSLALAERPEVRRAFDALSYSHRREYVIWIDDCKKLETRARRISRVVASLVDKMADQ
jgi:hypothetical protein